MKSTKSLRGAPVWQPQCVVLDLVIPAPPLPVLLDDDIFPPPADYDPPSQFLEKGTLTITATVDEGLSSGGVTAVLLCVQWWRCMTTLPPGLMICPWWRGTSSVWSIAMAMVGVRARSVVWEAFSLKVMSSHVTRLWPRPLCGGGPHAVTIRPCRRSWRTSGEGHNQSWAGSEEPHQDGGDERKCLQLHCDWN